MSYRKVGSYTKSLGRWRKERERRRRVRVLAGKGLTQKEIALELGVSRRTVIRDWAKVRSYVTSQCNKEFREMVQREKQEPREKYGFVFNEFELENLPAADPSPGVRRKPSGRR